LACEASGVGVAETYDIFATGRRSDRAETCKQIHEGYGDVSHPAETESVEARSKTQKNPVSAPQYEHLPAESGMLPL